LSTSLNQSAFGDICLSLSQSNLESRATRCCVGKCTICTKTCYQLEGHRVGPPGKEIVFHKRCFKCQNEGCGWQLTLTSYKFCDGKVWCANHCPVRGFSNPDHCKPTFDTSALAVETAMGTSSSLYHRIDSNRLESSRFVPLALAREIAPMIDWIGLKCLD